MTEISRTHEIEQIINEGKEMKLRLKEAEDTIEAIRSGEVDAIIVNGRDGEVVYSLRSAETPYRIILEEMNEGALILSSQGMILYCNRRFSELLSLPQEKIISSAITKLIAPSELAGFRKLFRKGIKEKTNGITSFISGNNKKIHAKVSIVGLPQSIGGDISIIVSDITDIRDYQALLEETVEKRSAELKEANNKLSEDVINIRKQKRTIEAVARKYKLLYDRLWASEDKYKDLVESANSIILKVDTKGIITFMNRYGLNFFGYTEEEIIGRNAIGTLIPWMDSSGSDLSGMVEAIMADPQKFSINEHENLRKDGSLIWISWTNKLTSDRNGNPTGILAIGNDITAFKNAEKAFHESESRYRRIVETSAEGILTTDVNGTIEYVNRKMAEMLGGEESEIVGKNSSDFSYETDIEHLIKLRNTVKSRNLSGEYKFRRTDGSLQWTSFNAVPLHDMEGRYIGNLAMHTDINDKKKSEEQLYISEERFRTAFEKGAVPMALVTFNSEFIRVNSAYCALTGYSEKELIGKMSYVHLTHPDDLKTNMEGFDKVLKGLIPSFRMEKRYIRKNGEIIWVDISTAPVKNKNGDLEYLVTHIQDINDRKKAETELKSFGEKLDLALESGHIGIWEMDLQNDKVILDPRMKKIFEIEQGTFGGTISEFEELINEEDLPYFKKALADSYETGTLAETIFRTNLKNDRSKYISAKATIKRDDLGNPAGLTGICFDVTGMKEGTEKTIVKINEELLRSNRELESFAYVASHDLQEPLRMVASFTQMLNERYGDKLDQDARDYIKFAVDGAKRMYELINGLLAYSRIQTKGKEFSYVSMTSVAGKVLNNLSLVIREKNVRIRKYDLPVIFADESQMIQLVQNLFENAIKFSKKKPSINFTASEKVDHFQFSVKDNGIGIEPQYFEKIFKIFQQLMPKEEYEGTGIGLAICRRIVERHRGDIWVESVPGKGSTFFFTIPKKQT